MLPPLLQQVRNAAEIAFAAYRPRPYAGKVTFVKVAEPLVWFCDPLPAWRRVAGGGIEIHEMPGDHLGLLREPHVDRFAAILASSLDRSDADAEPSMTGINPAERTVAEATAAGHAAPS